MRKSAIFFTTMLLGIGSCGTVPGLDSPAGMHQSEFAAVIASYPEYRETGLPLAITELTQQSINEERQRLQNETLEAARPEPMLATPYTVGPRDKLSVIVWDHPELNAPTDQQQSTEEGGNLVSAEGAIFYPYVGTVEVAGLTVDQIRDKLTKLLSVKIVNPQLDVRVSAYRSKKAFVVGEVSRPGLQPITDNALTLIDAINNAGGLNDQADLSQVTLSRKKDTYKLDLNALFLRGDTSQNLRLIDGDILKIPNIRDSNIYVLGKVWKPALKSMSSKRKTLAEAVEEAGGVHPITTKPAHYFVIRGTSNGPKAFHLGALAPNALILLNNFEVLANDIIYVEDAGPAFWKTVYKKLLQYSEVYGNKLQT